MQYQGRLWKFGDNINTDMIIAGEHLGTNDPEILCRHCFAGANPDWAKQVKPGDIVVAGKNFGCGSSREQAPLAVKAAGVSCIIAESFGVIFYRNAVNIGLTVIELPEAATLPAEGSILLVDMLKSTLVSGEKIWNFQRPGDIIMSIMSVGGLIPYIRAQFEAVAQ